MTRRPHLWIDGCLSFANFFQALSLLCSERCRESFLAHGCNATNKIILIGHETSNLHPALPHLAVFSLRENTVVQVCIWVGISTFIASRTAGYLCISNTWSTADPRILPLPRGFGRGSRKLRFSFFTQQIDQIETARLTLNFSTSFSFFSNLQFTNRLSSNYASR